MNFFSRRRVVGWSAGVWLFASVAYASPADVPLNHWSYEAIERLSAAGLCSALGLGMRPVTRDWVAEKVAEILRTIDEKELEISKESAYFIEEDILRLSKEFAPELVRREDADTSEGGRPTGAPFRWKDFLFQTKLVSEKFVTDFKRDSSSSLVENSQGLRLKDGFNGRIRLPSWITVGDWFAATLDPSLRIRKEDSETDADFEEASVKVAYSNLELRAGKLNFWWGPGYHGELLLTNNILPLRAFSLRTRREFRLPWKLKRLGVWQAQLIGAQLEEKRTPSEDLLTGVRLEWVPVRRLVFGTSHTALFGGNGEKEGIAEFFNALDPTSGGGEQERIDHLFNGDVRLFIPEVARWTKLGSGFELYGEFFGEDVKGFYIPDQVSYLAGFFLTDLFTFSGLDFRFEGAKTYHSAYEHFVHRTGYRFKEEFIGHHAGPDAEDLFVRLTKTFFVDEKRFTGGLQFDWERRGISGEALPFSGTALDKREFQVDMSHSFSEYLDILLAYQFEDINTFKGSSGVDSDNHLVLLQTELHF